MSYEVDAVYSKGTFVPVTPLPLSEGVQVHLRVDEQLASAVGEVERPKLTREEMAAFLKKMAELPVESPDDGFSAADHDKVIYRLP